jgi:hypothetical protein
MTYLIRAVIALYRLSCASTKPYTYRDFHSLFNRFPILTAVALLTATFLNFAKEKNP